MRMLYRRTTPAEVLELERDPDLAAHLLADGPDDRLLALGRAWHGVHFLLNGSAWGGVGPAFDAVLGGRRLGDPTTYEPVRLLTPDEVVAVAAHLAGQTPQVVTPRFTHRAAQQAELYPDDAYREPDVLSVFLLPALARLATFVERAAGAGDALLVQLQRD